MNTSAPPSPTALIVDDIPANLDILRHLLESDGFRVLAATNGPAALQIAARTQPDLVLLDVMMPELDGFETCRQLKQDASQANLPVLFITAQHEVSAVIRGFAVGGVDYIVKPFQKEEVLARVRTHLRLRQLNLALSERNRELEQLTAELRTRTLALEDALANIRTLKGLLPICAHCKKVRDDQGFWQQVEAYVAQRSDARFSHGICPECTRQFYAEYLPES